MGAVAHRPLIVAVEAVEDEADLGECHVGHRRLAGDLQLDCLAIVVADPEAAAGGADSAVQLRAALLPASGRAQRRDGNRAERLSQGPAPYTRGEALPPAA